MQQFFQYQNVFIDPASEYSLDEINERNYLISLFRSLNEILSTDFDSFHFFLLFSRFTDTVPLSSSSDMANKVLFWFAEESGELPYHICNDYLIVFKSYIKCEQQNMYSNPLGYVNEFEANDQDKSFQKDINLFFAGNLNHNRTALYELFFFKKFPYLKVAKIFPFSMPRFSFSKLGIYDLSVRRKNYLILFFKGFKKGFQYKTYREILSRSLFVVCPKGFISSETFRHVEALACNCIVISEKMPDVPIYQDHPFLTFSTKEELNDIINKFESGCIDERALLEKHTLYYKKYFEISAIAKRIAKICLATERLVTEKKSIK
jgi:hypothetical protein